MKAHSIVKACVTSFYQTDPGLADVCRPLPPMMIKDNGSQASSPMQVTPDEISAFTPSSTTRPNCKPGAKRLPNKLSENSSPTPTIPGKIHLHASDEQDAGMSLDDQLARDLARYETRDHVEAKRQFLRLKKEATLRELKWKGKAKHMDDSDEELSIAPKPEPIVRFIDVKPNTTIRTAKSVLSNYKPSNASNKNRQAVLKLAGRKSSPHEELTETMADFAGKTFKHADMRASNGGARPAGQKINREALINQKDLNALTMAQHQKQALLLRIKKEEMYNVKRKIAIPPKQTAKLEELERMIEAMAAREKAGISIEDDDNEDEEEDDDDFQPSGSEADGQEVEEGDALQYSGDEDEDDAADGEDEDVEVEVEDANDMDIELEAENDGDKENEPPIPETSSHTESRESRKTPRPLHASTSRSPRQPLGEVESSQKAGTPQAFASTFVDVGGFDNEGGSPGFSQLFEATQAAGPSGEPVSRPSNIFAIFVAHNGADYSGRLRSSERSA